MATKQVTKHKIGTRDEWLAARLELLKAEKELTRRGDELARMRQELPWVRIDKDYRFDTDEGKASLADLFKGRSQLLIYHFMFGPEYKAGCISCSSIADGFDGFVVHLANHDVTLCAVSQAPLEKLQVYKRRVGWSFPWASSYGGDFNFDFHVSHTKEQEQSGPVEYNFRLENILPVQPVEESSSGAIRCGKRSGLRNVYPRRAWRERVCAARWRRISYVLGILAWGGRPLGHVPVARPLATRSQRGRPWPVVAPPRRVRQQVIYVIAG
jgi:predicted dithiol-disulfide oxidoreductase (DUF899 family)